jgi:hypothetical protein
MNISTLRPGLLVSLKSSIRGNVSYATREIEPDHIAEDGARRAVWETNRVIELPNEHEAAVKCRSKARSLITAICSPSSFGLLCPEAQRDRLTQAIEDARETITEFNRGAERTQISLYVMIGRVAADDVEAVRAINSEIRDLLSTMETGLRNLDVQGVRDAANKARAISSMLSPEAAEKARKAIEIAREAARKIVKAGDVAAAEIDEATLSAIRDSRTAFLDLEDAAEVRAPEVTARAIDLDDKPLQVEMSAAPAPSFSFDW